MTESRLGDTGIFQSLNWWMGQIADDSTWRDNHDPGKFKNPHSIPGWGDRYKVRIWGHHPEGSGDNAPVPEDKLPWATLMFPVTAGGGQGSSGVTPNLRQGNIVYGDNDGVIIIPQSKLSNIVDLLSYNTHYQAFVSNMVANESFLDSSILRDNVVLHAKSLGYLPRSAKSSSSLFDFNVFSTFSGLSGSAPISITIKAGTVFNAIKDKVSYSFSSPVDVVSPLEYVSPGTPGLGATAKFNSVRLYEGTFLSNTWTVDQNDLDQRFIIPNSGLDLDTLIVKVQPSAGSSTSDLYTRGVNITAITSETKCFFVQEIEDEKYELVFGDGVIGNKLPNGAKITTTYIISSGADANGIQGVPNFIFSGNVTNNQSVTPGNQTVTISNSPVSEGGAKSETIDSIKFQAPRFYSAQNRAVTADDYETIVRLVYPNVDDIFAYGGEESSPPEYGKVKICLLYTSPSPRDRG